MDSLFKMPNIRRLYCGDLLFFLGYWITYLNFTWLTYQVTGSSIKLGVVGFMLNIPLFFLLPISGVLADRFDKKKLLIIGGVLVLLVPLIFILYGLLSQITYSVILWVAVLYGIGGSILVPSTTAYIPSLVDDPKDIHKATSAISANTKVAQFVGSGLNGLLHLVVGVVSVFAVSLLCHLISLFNYLRINKKFEDVAENSSSHPIKMLWEGFLYTAKSEPLWATIMLAAVCSMTVIGLQWQMPLFAAQSLKGNIHTLSYLFFAGGLGGITSGIYLAKSKSGQSIMNKAIFGSVLISVTLMVFAISTQLWLSVIAIFFMDAGLVVVTAAVATTLQVITHESTLGRVMSFFAMGVFGFLSFSNFIIASLCHWLSESVGIFVIGVLCLLAALFYFIRKSRYHKQLTRYYQENNIDESRQPI
jgi:MFS family permease